MLVVRKRWSSGTNEVLRTSKYEGGTQNECNY